MAPMRTMDLLPRPDTMRCLTPKVWTLQGAAHDVEGTSTDAIAAPFKLLLQLAGHAEIHQDHRRAALSAGEFTLIDGARPFQIGMPSDFEQVLVALPRPAVCHRHRGIERRTALTHGAHASEALVRDLLLSLAPRAPELSARALLHVAAALVQLLGGLDEPSPYDARASLRQRALAMIELDIAEADAESLATNLGVSRRHLDAAFARTGRTLGQHLWERRLTLAAERLQQPGQSSHTEIADSVGFKDASHFARAFRHRFGMTPSQWRATAPNQPKET
jgi:AraC-like DNA-binding protein